MGNVKSGAKYERFITDFLEKVRPVFEAQPKLFRVAWDRETAPLYADVDLDHMPIKHSPCGIELAKSTSYRTLMVNGFSPLSKWKFTDSDILLESGLQILDVYWKTHNNQWNVVSRSPYVKFVLLKKIKTLTIEAQVTTTEITFDWYM